MLGGNIHKFALFTYKNFVIINFSKFIFLPYGKNSIFLSEVLQTCSVCLLKYVANQDCIHSIGENNFNEECSQCKKFLYSGEVYALFSQVIQPCYLELRSLSFFGQQHL